MSGRPLLIASAITAAMFLLAPCMSASTKQTNGVSMQRSA
jgi:hypothetical protein